MEFKIDTKDNFSTITPIIGTINANLTGALGQKCGEMRQSGRNNFIVDLQHCTEIDKATIGNLIKLHETCYAADCSLVFTGTTAKVMEAFKEGETDLVLNIAPRMEEAIDIVSMEILERDLFGEDQDLKI